MNTIDDHLTELIRDNQTAEMRKLWERLSFAEQEMLTKLAKFLAEASTERRRA